MALACPGQNLQTSVCCSSLPHRAALVGGQLLTPGCHRLAHPQLPAQPHGNRKEKSSEGAQAHRFSPQEKPFEAGNGSQGRRGRKPHGRANLRAGRGGWRSRVRIRRWGGSCSPFGKGMRQLSTPLEQGPQKGRSRVWEKLFPLGTLEKRGGTQAGRTEGRGAGPMLGLHVQTFSYRVGGWQDQSV